MKVFLTGGAGFIGSALAHALAADGHEVIALVRRPPRGALAREGIRQVSGDLSDPGGLDSDPDVRAELARADAVVHAAAVRRDWGMTPAALRRVNVASGPALLERATHARRFLFVSSVAVYGHPEGGPASERAPFRPSKRYGESKVEAETALQDAANARGMALTIARPGITYGPGDTYGMFANLARLIAQRRFLLVGSGESRVNLLWIDDLARGLVQALTREAAADEDFIFAGPEAIPVRRMAEAIAGAATRRLPRLHVPEAVARLVASALEGMYRTLGIVREPFLTKSKVDLFTREDLWDTTKARERLGFAPRVTLAEGAPRAVHWLREAGEIPK